MRSCQILYEGHYSGVMEPMTHYIPLRKDFSNFDEVVEAFRDPELRQRLTDNAHRDLIASGRYAYEAFVAGFDRELEAAGLSVPAGFDPEPTARALYPTRARSALVRSRARLKALVRVGLNRVRGRPPTDSLRSPRD